MHSPATPHRYSSKVKVQGHLAQLTSCVFILDCRAAVRRFLYPTVLLWHQATAFKRSNIKVIGEGSMSATISMKNRHNVTVLLMCHKIKFFREVLNKKHAAASFS